MTKLTAKVGQVIFAAGNKYKVAENASSNCDPVSKAKSGNYFVWSYRYIKSRNAFSKSPAWFNVGPHFEIVE